MDFRDLNIKIFADGANLNEMLEVYKGGIVKGFTTNPSLMKKAGIDDYKKFAKNVLEEIKDLPVSFEVSQMISRLWKGRQTFYPN